MNNHSDAPSLRESPTDCACSLPPGECHPDCPHHPLSKAIYELRRFQRHRLLREYGSDGHVLPENMTTSHALDYVLERLDRALASESNRKDGSSLKPAETPAEKEG